MPYQVRQRILRHIFIGRQHNHILSNLTYMTKELLSRFHYIYEIFFHTLNYGIL